MGREDERRDHEDHEGHEEKKRREAGMPALLWAFASVFVVESESMS